MTRPIPLLALTGALAVALATAPGTNAKPAAAANVGGPAASCAQAIPASGCAAQLRALCRAIGTAAVPPLARRQQDAMANTVATVSKEIELHWLDRASSGLDDLRRRLDDLQGSLDIRISGPDADRIGDALNDASFCVDGM